MKEQKKGNPEKKKREHTEKKTETNASRKPRRPTLTSPSS
jgi:hypothetical protein